MTDRLERRMRVEDGTSLSVTDWPVESPRGQVLIVHGLGEHAGRYAKVARWLNDRGYSVRAYDQVGHGASEGPRGGLQGPHQLLDHLSTVFAATARDAGELPVTLLGHSLGGLLVAAAVAAGRVRPHRLVLSSPALAVRMAAWQRLAVGWLPRLAPNLTLSNGLQPDYLSHDSAVVQAYRDDPLVHDRISARLGAFVAFTGTDVLSRAPQWDVPTLLLYAGADFLVDPVGSDRFAASAPPSVVTVHRFADLYHEIFNEVESAPVYAALEDWLNR